MKSPRYTLKLVAFGLRQAEDGTPTAEVCRKMGMNPPEGQLFTYTFTLPDNPRKFLNQLKKGKGLLKTLGRHLNRHSNQGPEKYE